MHTEVAVVGGGIVGLSVASTAVGRGKSVQCFDPAPGGLQSAGPGRIFRLAHDSARAVTLAQRALLGWMRWEDFFGHPLIRVTGCAVVGEDARAHAASLLAAGAEGTFSERGDLSSIRRTLRTEDYPALIDPAGGTVDSTTTVRALIEHVGPVYEQVKTVSIEGNVVRLTTVGGNVCTADRVVIATGARSLALGAHGLAPPSNHTFRHIRLQIRPSPQLANLGLAFLDRRRLSPSGWSFYGLELEDGSFCIGGGWGETPFEAGTWEWPDVRAHSESEIRYWLAHHGEVSPQVLDVVECEHPRFPLPGGSPYQVIRRGPFVHIRGNDLFKFAPAIGDDACVELDATM